MPEEGYKSITVTADLYAKLQELADKNSRSIAKQIEHFLKTCDKREV